MCTRRRPCACVCTRSWLKVSSASGPRPPDGDSERLPPCAELRRAVRFFRLQSQSAVSVCSHTACLQPLGQRAHRRPDPRSEPASVEPASDNNGREAWSPVRPVPRCAWRSRYSTSSRSISSSSRAASSRLASRRCCPSTGRAERPGRKKRSSSSMPGDDCILDPFRARALSAAISARRDNVLHLLPGTFTGSNEGSTQRPLI